MTSYKVESQLQHDGATFEKGEFINLDEAVAERLLNDGVLSEVDENVAPKKVMTAEEKKAEAEEGDEEKETETDKPVATTAAKTDYSKMLKKDLVKLAGKRGVEVPAKATAMEIAKLLDEADAEESDKL